MQILQQEAKIYNLFVFVFNWRITETRQMDEFDFNATQTHRWEENYQNRWPWAEKGKKYH